MKAMSLRARITPPHLGLMSQIVIVLLVVTLMGAMAIEPTRQLLEQRERVTTMKKDLNEVQASNAELRHRIKRLNDPDFIEQRAREQIGLVREGEITYVVMPPSRQARSGGKAAKANGAAPKKAKRAAAQPEAEEPGFFQGILDFVGF